jgi:hypothetical protein
MTDLQLGLLVVGAAAVVAVVVYNRVQERKVRREAQRAFGSQHADALLGERMEPVLRKPARMPAAHADDLPDPRIDYVMELAIERGTLAATVLEHWRSVEQRFGRRVLLAGAAGDGWRRVVAGEVRSLTALRAALQMANRSGVVNEPELVEFRSGVETMGAALGARVAAPEMREALQQARELDAFCSDNDIQVALHVAGGTLADRASLLLDVPRSGDAHGFEAMCREARDLAATHGASVVDDNGNALDERALRAIEIELEAVRARLAAAGIEPGSPLALRLFS